MSNLTCCEKAYIRGLRDGGMDVQKIAVKAGRSVSGVYRVLNDENANTSTEPAKPMGRPPKLTERDKRAVVLQARKNRRATLAEITNNVACTASMWTIRTALHEAEMHSRVAKLKPFLKPRHVEKRLDYAKKHASWTIDEWAKVIWTDESSFELGRNYRQVLVWRTTGEEYNTDCLAPTFKSNRSSVMVWGAITHGAKSELVIMDPKRRTAQDFVDQVYEGPLRRFMEVSGGKILMEDGAPVHRSNAPKKWREDNGVPKMDWPAQSPDLNPIENLWAQMKDAVQKRWTPSMTQETLVKVLLDAWENIDIERSNTLIESMPVRIKEVLKNKGSSTRW